MKTFCGIDCCKECAKLSECGGCEKCKGHPFGGSCIAERNIDFVNLRKHLIEEINTLKIEQLSVSELFLLNGSNVNLEYSLPNGKKTKLLNDEDIYLGNQIVKIGSDQYYGIVANEDFILVCEYDNDYSNPEIVLYKKYR